MASVGGGGREKDERINIILNETGTLKFSFKNVGKTHTAKSLQRLQGDSTLSKQLYIQSVYLTPLRHWG